MNLTPTIWKIYKGFYIPFFEITDNNFRVHPCYVIKPLNQVKPLGFYFLAKQKDYLAMYSIQENKDLIKTYFQTSLN